MNVLNNNILNIIKMVSNKSTINISFFLIFFLLIPFIPFIYNKQLYAEDINKYDSNNREQNDGWDTSSDVPPTDDGLIEAIQAAREKKDKMEIECQQKKIYVIALGVLSVIFLILLIIYGILKCYIFCISPKFNNTPFRRIRISKLGQVYLEENFDLNKNDINNNEDNLNDGDNNDKNDAPTCFSVDKNKNTFNPDNYNENESYNKPYQIDDN